jgi:hypothetical protein
MSSITNSIVKSVTLKPGEPFTLPPGATLIASDNADVLESTCDIPELESLQCYAFQIAVGDHDNSDTILWDAQGFTIVGWRYNGALYTVDGLVRPNDLGCFAFASFPSVTIVDTLSKPLKDAADAAGIFIDSIVTGSDGGDGDNGCINYVVVKTIPSVIEKLEIVAETSKDGFGSSTYPLAYFKPVPYSDYSGYSNLPACPSSSI